MNFFEPPRRDAKSGQEHAPNHRACSVLGWTTVLLAACTVLTGCMTPTTQRGMFAADYQPGNVFARSSILPAGLKRVAVMPLACEAQRSDLADGCEVLGPILDAELIKTEKFEVVSANPENLRNLTGRSNWTGTEALPADFFESLREAYGCDAVLFCQLTVFRAYEPLAVGWRMKLVDARTRLIIWASDEVFDAARPSVLGGASRFPWLEHKTLAEKSDDWSLRNSPRRFGQFSAVRVLATLPSR
jgi:hypothetical protein